MTSRTKPELKNKIPNISQDDAIDLRGLVKAFWKGKFTIITCTFLFSLASVFYALYVQQWWTAKAVITTPKVAEVAIFSQTVKRYQPAFDTKESNSASQLIMAFQSYQSEETENSGLELDNLIERESLFNRFVQTFNATNNKRKFLKQSNVFSQWLLAKDIHVEESHEYRIALNEWLKKINAIVEDEKKENVVTLSAESFTKESSLHLINNYIEFTNEKVTTDLIQDLRSILKIKNHELSQRLESRKELIARKLKSEIAKTERALQISNAAQLRKPIENLNKKEIFSIDLGADAISEKLNVLKSLEDLSILDSNIEEIKNRLNLLQREVPKIESFKVFSYLGIAELPLNRDKPKRAVIVMLGTLIGCMLGMIIVLFRLALRKGW
ncbi:LPS O-antigen chain length determinant protein WzzB [Enterovibrio norvegicus]|uniref:LPS O-antigen chain length determinant protein WzzB n=1 Tax=Enterovibrio norvegicus TaxID=188144 RepID=A0ABV4KW96_9GAMM|nr:Wzz/FepE/Etk N-terminal domain-containing protein [Enterovibrio norvegicus]OEF58816.1 hypothetical protein A1OU_11715 [Enterovibrio norvegicus]